MAVPARLIFVVLLVSQLALFKGSAGHSSGPKEMLYCLGFQFWQQNFQSGWARGNCQSARAAGREFLANKPREGLIKSTDSVLQALTADAKNRGSVKR